MDKILLVEDDSKIAGILVNYLNGLDMRFLK